MKKISIIFTLLLLTYQAKSCDACGGSLGSSYFGLLPQMSNSFVGLNYTYAKFNAAMGFNSEVLEDEYSDDTFQRLELNARVTLYKRLQALIILPYSLNEMDGSHQRLKNNGIGDPSFLLSYRLFDQNSDDRRSVNQTMLIGMGVKLPFGKFDQSADGELVNQNFQLGSGSLDYIFSLNHTLMFENMGLNSDFSYKWNTSNGEYYKFGNQLALTTNVFWIKKLKDVVFIPIIGVYLEYGEIHTIGTVEQSNTGGEVLMSNLGAQLMLKRLTFNASYRLPFYQKFNSDNITEINAGNRLSFGLNFNF